MTLDSGVLSFFHCSTVAASWQSASKLAPGTGLQSALRSLLVASLFLGMACPGLRAAEKPAPPEAATSKHPLNVKDFGAVGDGKAKDTVAFQKALDACAGHGTGTVLVPKGMYLIGSIVVRSNTTLQIERGANLCGSADIEDYPLVRVRWEGEFSQGHRALISAEKADNITLTGGGSIFGPPLALSKLRNPRGPLLVELTECKKRTPVDTGALRASEHVEGPTREGRKVSVAIVAGGPAAPYALTVHEDLEANHPRGGQAKYIESTLNESAPYIGERVAKRIEINKAL